MPPRKSDQRRSDVSTARAAPPEDAADDARPATPSAADGPGQSAAPTSQEKKDRERDKDKDAVTIEDLTLPKSIITRLAKGVLPPNTQIQANAILALSKSATVFINHLASFANEHTVNAGKKTISPNDVFKALDDVEFAFLREALEAEFAKFNAIQTEKRTSYRQKVRAQKEQPGDDTDMADTTMADSTTAGAGADTTTTTTTAGGSDADAAPRAKKPRVDPSSGGDEEDDAETEEEEPEQEEEEEEEEEDDVEEDEDEDEGGEREEGGQGSGDETQDALEEREAGDDADEALEGDESD